MLVEYSCDERKLFVLFVRTVVRETNWKIRSTVSDRNKKFIREEGFGIALSLRL